MGFQRAAPTIPYIAVFIGLYVFSSAWLAFILYHVGILFFLRKQFNPQSLFRGYSWLAIPMVLFGITGGLLIFLLWEPAGLGLGLDAKLSALGLSGLSLVFFAFYHTFINSWFEQSFWNSRLLEVSRWPVLNDFLFAGYHLLVLYFFTSLPWLVLAFLVLSFAAFVWRRIVIQNNGLLVPILSHIAADGAIMLVLVLKVMN